LIILIKDKVWGTTFSYNKLLDNFRLQVDL